MSGQVYFSVTISVLLKPLKSLGMVKVKSAFSSGARAKSQLGQVAP